MNNKIKLLIAFVVGAAGGSVVTNKLLRTKYENYAKEEMGAYRNYILDQINGEIVEREDIPQDVILTDDGYDEDEVDYDFPTEKKKVEEVHYKDFTKKEHYKKADRVEYSVKAGAYSQKMDKLKEEALKSNLPYEITKDAYDNDRGDYDKVELHFWEDDDIVSDDNDEIFNDVEFAIGEDSLFIFGTDHGNEDPDIIYIRNESLTTDYEIICYHNSYAATVLGYE